LGSNKSYKWGDYLLQRTKRRYRRDDTLAGFLFAFPWVVGFLVFQLYPIIMSGFYSFTKFNAVTAPIWVGLDNYTTLFKEPIFYKSLSNTLLYTSLAVPITIFMGLLVAVLLNMKIPMRGIFRSLFFLPSIVPLVASILGWIWIFDPMYGYLNKILGRMGLRPINWLGNPSYTKLSLVIITVWGFGTTMVIFLAAIQDIPRTYYEAAQLDGANQVQTFWSITLPNIAHVVMYQVILCIINSFQYFTQAYVIITSQSGSMVSGMAGGPQNSLLMYPLLLFYNAFTQLEMGKASAMAWLLFVFVGLLTLLILKISKRWMLYDD